MVRRATSPRSTGLAFESGDPQFSLDNVQRMIDAGLVIRYFMVRPTGVLILFAKGEQYYAPGLRVGTSSLATEALAHLAAEAGFGPEEQLLQLLPKPARDLQGELPDLKPDPCWTASQPTAGDRL